MWGIKCQSRDFDIEVVKSGEDIKFVCADCAALEAA
jgi:hypothetical protein